jgi:RNA polymerase sigma-70 factor, ECF subfamily
MPWSGVEGSVPSVQIPPHKLANHELVVFCQTNGQRPDRVGFSELMRRHQSHVDRVLYHLAPDWDDRADLAQEVWIRVYRNICRLQEPVKFRGWLSRIATNLFYDELRKRKRHKSPLSLDAPLSMEDGEVSWEIASEDPRPMIPSLPASFTISYTWRSQTCPKPLEPPSSCAKLTGWPTKKLLRSQGCL